MLSYLLLFVAAVFLLRVPFFLLGLLFRFSKPLALIGFGCILGIVGTTGAPDFSQLDSLSEPQFHQEERVPSRRDMREGENAISPDILEAANRFADGLQDVVLTMVAELANNWEQSTDRKIAGARKASEADYRALSRNMKRERR